MWFLGSGDLTVWLSVMMQKMKEPNVCKMDVASLHISPVGTIGAEEI